MIIVGQIVSILYIPEAEPWGGGYTCMVELALLVAMRVEQLSNDFQIIYALATALAKIRRASSLERSRAHLATYRGRIQKIIRGLYICKRKAIPHKRRCRASTEAAKLFSPSSVARTRGSLRAVFLGVVHLQCVVIIAIILQRDRTGESHRMCSSHTHQKLHDRWFHSIFYRSIFIPQKLEGEKIM